MYFLCPSKYSFPREGNINIITHKHKYILYDGIYDIYVCIYPYIQEMKGLIILISLICIHRTL